MTRKHYTSLAADLHIDYLGCKTEAELLVFTRVLDSIVRALSMDNPRFDKAKFVSAVIS